MPIYTVLNGKDLYDISAINQGDLTINPSDKTEKILGGKLDWEKKFVVREWPASFKTGIKYRSSKMDTDSRSAVYTTGSLASGFPYASLLKRTGYVMNGTPITLVPDMDKVQALFVSSPRLFTQTASQQTETFRNDFINDFNAGENTSAAYVMGTLTFGRTTAIVGLRGEKNDFKSTTWQFNPATASAPMSYSRVDRERDYTVWLPGLHFRHALRKNLILRESYNRSYGRPELGSLLQGRVINYDTDTISDGNAFLNPTTSHNFDVQLEYYTAKSGLYSVGLFYKKMRGFYYDTTTSEEILDETEGITKPFRVTRPENALGATNYGVEMIARQKLYFLPKPFDGLGVSLSATISDSDGRYPGRLEENLPTYGFSDKMFHSSVDYTIGKLRMQISYRYRTEYLEGLDNDNTFDDWFAAREQVDFESSYQLTRKMRLFLNVDNVTARPQVSYQGYQRTDNPEDFSQYGFRAVTGVNLTF
jgi:TonB-dependent receptor